MRIIFLIQESKIQVVFQCVHGFNYLCVHTCVTICVQIYVFCNSLCEWLYMCVCVVVSMCMHGVQESISSNDYVQDVTFVCVYISGAWLYMFLCDYVDMCACVQACCVSSMSICEKKRITILCNFVWNLSCIVVEMIA
jgi:hypothetical protein